MLDPFSDIMLDEVVADGYALDLVMGYTPDDDVDGAPMAYVPQDDDADEA